MGHLSTETQTRVICALVEGSSVRSTERMTGVHRDTITKLVLRVGRACDRLMREEIRHVRSRELQLDELWCFVQKKRNHMKPSDDERTVGDQWIWTALDPETKLIPHHHVGKRNESEAVKFAAVLRSRIEGRVQISTDKLAAYRWAINLAWDGEVDYGRIVKRYRVEPASWGRYSPPECVGVSKDVIMGNPDVDRISTSLVERANLTARMGMRRLTRLTNGFSKKLENLKAACAIHYAHYNFVRVHSTIKTTPAIASGLTDRRFTVEDLAILPY